MHSVFSLSLPLSFFLLFSLAPATLLYFSLSHTFSLIWQKNEPCRWKSFQHVSRKLICFHNKRDPFSWIHLYTSRCTKQEVVSGPCLPLHRSPSLSVPVFQWFGHTHTVRAYIYLYIYTLFFFLPVSQNLLSLIYNGGWLLHACVCLWAEMRLATISFSPLTVIAVFGNNLGSRGGLHCNHTEPGLVAISSWLGYWANVLRRGWRMRDAGEGEVAKKNLLVVCVRVGGARVEGSM